MGNESTLIIIVTFWLASSLYVMDWHRNQGNLSFGTILVALLMGPILAIVIRDDKVGEKKRRRTEEEITKEHMDWLNEMSRLSSIQIPPPPPVTQRKESKKDFKFFQK